MSIGSLKRMLKTRQNVLKCKHVNMFGHARSNYASPATDQMSLPFARRTNLSYDEDEGLRPSAASAAFLEEVSNFTYLGYGFRLHSLTLGLLIKRRSGTCFTKTLIKALPVLP